MIDSILSGCLSSNLVIITDTQQTFDIYLIPFYLYICIDRNTFYIFDYFDLFVRSAPTTIATPPAMVSIAGIWPNKRKDPMKAATGSR